MNKKIALFLCISLYFTSLEAKIKHIFIDPNVFFVTSAPKASWYVGKWNSLKYAAKTGHIPSKKHLFNALRSVPAYSSTITYDETLTAPLIVSDWLLGVPATDLKQQVKQFLNSSSLSKPEKKVYTNTTNMMFDGRCLAEVQKVRKKSENLLRQLKQAGYKIYFTGNWAEIQSIKAAYPHIFSLVDDVCISSEMKLLKPQRAFWETLWDSKNLNPAECLCIEAELKFYQTASQLPCKTIFYQYKNLQQFCIDLQRVGVVVSL